MKCSWTYVIPLCALLLAPANADPLPAPTPAASPPAPAPQTVGGHPYDPCAMVSQRDIASAAGVATNQVFTPTSPTKDECIWAIGSKAGAPGQQVTLTLQTIDQVKQAHGLGRFAALLGVVQSLPGVGIVNNPIVTRAFAGAQTVASLGDRAGWQNGSLSVLKNQLLFAVGVSGQPSDSAGLKVATSVAQSVLEHLPTP
jgi:hypothetical protein